MSPNTRCVVNKNMQFLKRVSIEINIGIGSVLKTLFEIPMSLWQPVAYIRIYLVNYLLYQYQPLQTKPHLQIHDSIYVVL